MALIPPRWKHQEEAFSWARRLYAQGHHGLMLAMWMGTGKSRLGCELALAERAEQLLILSPLRVVSVWEEQLARFAPGHFQVVALDDRVSSVKEKIRLARELYTWSEERHHPVAILVNYDSARLYPFGDWAASHPWSMVIADECHRLKEARGRTSMWAAKLGRVAFRRLGLTGTPMPQIPIDIWGQFRFLDPYHLEPSYGAFRDRYAVMGGYYDREITGWQHLEELEERFRALAFRVGEEVLELPPEMDETRTAPLSKEGARIYAEMEREMLAWIAEGVQVTAANALVRLLRLQQITGGGIEDESGKRHTIDHAKEDLLEELLIDLGEPVVVFCRFKADLEAVHRAAHRAERKSLELSGSRDDLRQWQQTPEPVVLAVQMQAGGVGVDLSRARVAIYYSHGFSLAEYLQSRARVRRPPQTRPCVFYHLQIQDSIDQHVLEAIHARRDLVEAVLDRLKQKGGSYAAAHR